MHRFSSLPLHLFILSLIAGPLSGFDLSVTWSFTSFTESRIKPYPNTDDRFRSDFSPLGNDTSVIFPPGKSGNGLFVDGKSFNLVTDIERTCLSDFDRCKNVFWSFYLKIKSWNGAENPVIMRTTPPDRSSHGFYIGKGDGDDILFYFRGSSGKTHSVTVSQNHFLNEWEHVGIAYRGDPLVVTIGTSTSTKTTYKITYETPTLNNNPTNLVVGSADGPSFYLDSVTLKYDAADVVEITTTTSTTPTTTTTTITSTLPTTTTTSTTPTTKTTTTPPTTTTTTTTRTIPTTTTTVTTPATTTTATMTSTTPTSTTPTNTSTIKKTSTMPTSTSTARNLSTTTKMLTSTIYKVDYREIWLPILIIIAIVVIGVVITCIFYFCCRRKKRRNSHRVNGRNGVPLNVMRNGYSQANQVDSANEFGSHVDTEDTDGEGSHRNFIH